MDLFVSYTEQRLATPSDSPYNLVSVERYSNTNLYVEPRLCNNGRINWGEVRGCYRVFKILKNEVIVGSIRDGQFVPSSLYKKTT